MTEQAPYRQHEQNGRKFVRTASELLFVGLIAFNWLATQRAAAAMHYAPFLSGRLIAHVYQPFGWWWWQYRWPHSGLQIGNRVIFLAPMWRVCEHLVIYPMLVLGGIAALFTLFLMKPHTPADLHGSATWADAREITKAGL